jgi:pimeloyl-ACP methyl ester carboxylesterase
VSVIDGAIKRTVVSNGVELALIEAGDSARPTLVFVHGYPDTKEIWD